MAVKTVAYTINPESRTVTATMSGRTPLTVHMERMSQENRDYAPLFGLQSRLSNAAAVERNQDGRILTSEEMLQQRYERMRAIAEHLNSGSPDWDLPRVGGERDVHAILRQAIMRVMGCDEDTAKAKIDKLGAVRIAGIREVADAMAAIRAERAGGTVASLDDLMAA